MATVEIRTIAKVSVPARLLKRVADKILQEEGKPDVSVSIALVGETRMREANRIYRKKDYATNVLSFSGQGSWLGEILLCPKVIRRDAVTYGIIFKEEFLHMFVHGLLHLLEYDHESAQGNARMSRKERSYLSLFS